MGDTPEFPDYVEDLWEDWEQDLEDYVEKGGEQNVIDHFQEEIARRMDIRQPQTAGQRFFAEGLADYIREEAIKETDPTFGAVLRRLERRQAALLSNKLEKAETVTQARRTAERLGHRHGFKIRTTPDGRIVVEDILPKTIQKAEVPHRKRFLQDLSEKFNERVEELQSERLQDLRVVGRGLKAEVKELISPTERDILRDIANIKTGRDVIAVSQRIEGFPRDVRRRLVRLVKIRNQELMPDIQQPVLPV